MGHIQSVVHFLIGDIQGKPKHAVSAHTYTMNTAVGMVTSLTIVPLTAPIMEGFLNYMESHAILTSRLMTVRMFMLKTAAPASDFQRIHRVC